MRVVLANSLVSFRLFKKPQLFLHSLYVSISLTGQDAFLLFTALDLCAGGFSSQYTLCQNIHTILVEISIDNLPAMSCRSGLNQTVYLPERHGEQLEVCSCVCTAVCEQPWKGAQCQPCLSSMLLLHGRALVGTLWVMWPECGAPCLLQLSPCIPSILNGYHKTEFQQTEQHRILPRRISVFLEAKTDGICDYLEHKLNCVQTVSAEKHKPAAQVS